MTNLAEGSGLCVGGCICEGVLIVVKPVTVSRDDDDTKNF